LRGSYGKLETGLVEFCYYPDKEVDHKEDVEGEIDLLRGAVGPSFTRLDRLTEYTHTHTTATLSHLVLLSSTHVKGKVFP